MSKSILTFCKKAAQQIKLISKSSGNKSILSQTVEISAILSIGSIRLWLPCLFNVTVNQRWY